MIPIGMFADKRQIGSGGYGKVYDFGTYVVKQIRLSKNVMREAEILKELNHQNIVKMLSYKLYQDGLLIQFQKCDGSLEKLEENMPFEEEEAIEVVHQVGSALRHLYEKKVRHRDIKISNILYDKIAGKTMYKLADFGVSLNNIHPEQQYIQSFCGTPGYMSPQMVQQKPYTSSCDVWSLGIVFFQLLFKRSPQFKASLLTTNFIDSQRRKFNQSLQKLKNEVSKELLIGMLTFQKDYRISLKKLLEKTVNFKQQRQQKMIPIMSPLSRVSSNQCLNNNFISPQRDNRPISAEKTPIVKQKEIQKAEVGPGYTMILIKERDLMSLLEIQLKSKYIPFSTNGLSRQLEEQIECREKKQFEKIKQGLKREVRLQCQKSMFCFKK